MLILCPSPIFFLISWASRSCSAQKSQPTTHTTLHGRVSQQHNTDEPADTTRKSQPTQRRSASRRNTEAPAVTTQKSQPTKHRRASRHNTEEPADTTRKSQLTQHWNTPPHHRFISITQEVLVTWLQKFVFLFRVRVVNRILSLKIS